MTTRRAKVYLKNDTGRTFEFQILHQYTGKKTERSKFVRLATGQSAKMLTVSYRTGLFTTGVDNWIVNGIERREITTKLKLPSGLTPIEIDGSLFVELRWASGVGAGSDWKVHTLRAEDDGRKTIFTIRANTVEIRSKSGSSSTSWNPDYEMA